MGIVKRPFFMDKMAVVTLPLSCLGFPLHVFPNYLFISAGRLHSPIISSDHSSQGRSWTSSETLTDRTSAPEPSMAMTHVRVFLLALLLLASPFLLQGLLSLLLVPSDLDPLLLYTMAFLSCMCRFDVLCEIVRFVVDYPRS
ncbi:hypothetical protein SAY87_025644 [Trapa incisa]|uniref:Uncharacterized protein n=1 Tax=Trapa incisa TaxID=236973 RepID=A0AAN7H1N8_9MYRT|nr:hypothetical protein SAY87_025644 [Trapa incisa]